MKIKIEDIRGLPAAIRAMLEGDRDALERALADDALPSAREIARARARTPGGEKGDDRDS